MCRWAARVVARLDRDDELAFLPLRDASAGELLAGIPEEERHATWRLLRADGSLVGYGAGGVDLLASMRLTRPLGRFLGLVPTRVLDSAYRLIARNRSRLGRFVPNGPGPRRP